MKTNPEGPITFECHGAAVTLDAGVLAKLWLDKVRQESGAQSFRGSVNSTGVDLAVAPRIGQEWPGQGGIYAGIAAGQAGAPDYHVIVPAPAASELTWDAATKWAAGLDVDGHRDFSLPSRPEQALLYANVPQLFEREWYWSNTQHASNPSCAWSQNFSNGSQNLNHKNDELRARAVRRLAIQ